MIGKTLGKYRILAALGRGGMGTVYKALDETIGREVALKVLTPEMLHGDALTQFEAEAKRLAALNHPRIAALHEIYHAPNEVLMVMELVHGATLDRLLAQSGPLPVSTAASLVAQVLSALAHAHAEGIVHRDVKPSNVMVTDAGGVKLLDFGASRVSGAALMTAVGPTLGASAYMAPERILGNEVDSRADLYSVAVLFYRLVTGTLPFEAAAVPELIQKQLTAAPLSARSQRADLPEWCEQLLARALAKSPEARFQTAEEFKAALLSGTGSLDEGPGIFEALSSAPTLLAPIPVESVANASQPGPADTILAAALDATTIDQAPAEAALDVAQHAGVDPMAATLLTPIPAREAVASPEVATPVPLVDPLAATLAAPVPSPAALAPTLLGAPGPMTVPPPVGTTLPVGGVLSLPNSQAVDPLAATLAAPIPEAISLPPTLTMPLEGGPVVPPTALAPTLAAPVPGTPGDAAPVNYSAAGWAPTQTMPGGALAPTELAPAPALRSGPTLVMQRKQFAAAGVLLAALALGVVILAVIVLRRPTEVVVPGGAAPPASPVAGAASTPPAPPEVPSAPVPPTEIVDLPVRPVGGGAPPDPPLVSSGRAAAQPAAGAATPTDRPAAAGGSGAGARPTNTVPFLFDARAVVSEGDKHREREARVLIADGSLKVSERDDKPLYVLSLPDITSLTYSSSRQPLWDSPSGPAEALRVDGGTFGFLKGGRNNWFGIRTNSSLLVLRVDDAMVARVITGLQERIGLPVARLIEPKE